MINLDEESIPILYRPVGPGHEMERRIDMLVMDVATWLRPCLFWGSQTFRMRRGHPMDRPASGLHSQINFGR
jgi:hypothetical protein